MQPVISRIIRVSGAAVLSAGLLLGTHHSQARGQVGWPPDEDFKWWVDGNGRCPAGCDSSTYNCPCAVIHPT